MHRFSFDIRSVMDDDRRRLLKKYRETKKKVKSAFRRQADEGKLGRKFCQEISFIVLLLEIVQLLDAYKFSNESKLTLINELIYECQRNYPTFLSRLNQYKITLVTEFSLKEDEPSSSSSSSSTSLITMEDDYM